MGASEVLRVPAVEGFVVDGLGAAVGERFSREKDASAGADGVCRQVSGLSRRSASKKTKLRKVWFIR